MQLNQSKLTHIMCKIKIAGCGIFSNKDDISIFNIYNVHVTPNHFQVVSKKMPEFK